MNIKQTFFESFKTYSPEINDNEVQFLDSNTETKYLKKGELLLKSNSIQKSLAFIVEGLVRGYYFDDQGKEITISFLKENEYVTDYVSFINQKPSKYNFVCLEECVIVELSFDAIQQAYENSKSFEKYGRVIAEKVLEERINRVEQFQFLNAKQRYIDFINTRSDLLNKIKISHLSSYLGIERQSLTRIRKEIFKNGTNVSS